MRYERREELQQNMEEDNSISVSIRYASVKYSGTG